MHLQCLTILSLLAVQTLADRTETCNYGNSICRWWYWKDQTCGKADPKLKPGRHDPDTGAVFVTSASSAESDELCGLDSSPSGFGQNRYVNGFFTIDDRAVEPEVGQEFDLDSRCWISFIEDGNHPDQLNLFFRFLAKILETTNEFAPRHRINQIGSRDIFCAFIHRSHCQLHGDRARVDQIIPLSSFRRSVYEKFS
ncbi:hypothetical protein CDD80_7500 [Ophiocordyceps camponoti-rufipedis]|uniref:Uncharacterized protein n=1 Tax=Ophiocordyceps camponoti-rufipedis TaxID=2004952 RepID=A0A2C5XQL2_9HYPO|nr:hypothetical protein CDD80_7500 [Ophiocordyceps camponoti-rufipedis]